MATYASLSTAQKQQLSADMDVIFRPYAGELATLLNNISQEVTIYNQNGTAAILSTLGASEIIPNSTGLAGALDINAFQWGLWFNMLSGANSGVLPNANTDAMKGVYGMMAGPSNCVG